MGFPWRVTAGAAMVVVFLVFYFSMAAGGGFKGTTEDWQSYGERPVSGPIRQPVCYWTAMAFVVTGLSALLWLDLTPRTSLPVNPMTGSTMFSVPLGLLMVWLGPGSMLEHGTLKESWGWFDASSIHWYGLYVLGYLILRWIPGGTERWLGRILFWVGHFLAAFLIGLWGALNSRVREPWTGILLGVAGVGLLVSLIFGRWVGLTFEPIQGWIAFSLGMALFVFGLVVVKLGYEKGPTDNWGHPVWHVCVGLVTFCIFLILRAERPRTSA